MARLLPEGATISFTQSASSISSNIIIDDISRDVEVFEFDRKEFSNDFLLNLPNSDGTSPILQKNIMNKTIQTTFVGCGINSDRNVLPDDANVDSILRKFIIRKYSLRGGPSNPSAVDSMELLAKDHASRYSVFEGYFKLFGQKLSYQYFYNLRNETFNYITQTGLSMSAFAGSEAISESNCLIRNFSSGFMYRNPATGYIIIKDWSLDLYVYQLEEAQRVF